MWEDTEVAIVDLTIFTSLIIAFSFGSVSRVIKAKLMNLYEDEIKLTADYNHLLKYYSGSAAMFGKMERPIRPNGVSWPLKTEWLLNNVVRS